MIETVFHLTQADQKTIERVAADENIHYMHMILPQGDRLPEHDANANVYMTVVRGTLTIALAGEPAREYPAGTLLRIPVRTHMNVVNAHPETLELIVVKAPAPAGK